MPPPFTVEDGAHVIPVNDLARLEGAPSEYVIAGAGKTATDACVWLLAHGVDPDRITWVRPREPWMFDRAVVQPDPAIFLGMVATLMEAGRHAVSPEDFFLRLEDAEIMLRIDRAGPHDGQGAHARAVGARAAPDPRAGRPSWPPDLGRARPARLRGRLDPRGA